MSKKRKLEETKEYKTDPKYLSELLQTKCGIFKRTTTVLYVAHRKDKILDIWNGMIRHKFQSVPVLQETGDKYYGFIDIADIVDLFIKKFGEETIREGKVWEKKEDNIEMDKLTVDDVMRYPLTRRNPFKPVAENYSLLFAMELLARERTLKRVPVINDQRFLVNILTQSFFLNHIVDNIEKIGNKKDKPVSKFRNFIRTNKVHIVQENDMAIYAFNLMILHDISSIGIVNKDKEITGNLSLRDLKLVMHEKNVFKRLFTTTKEFESKLSTKKRPRSVVSVKPSDTLENVVNKLAIFGLHHVFVVKNKKPVGVVSLKDVLFEILNDD